MASKIWSHKRRRRLESENQQGDKNVLCGAVIIKFVKSLRLI